MNQAFYLSRMILELLQISLIALWSCNMVTWLKPAPSKILNAPERSCTQALIASVPSLIPAAPTIHQTVLSAHNVQRSFGGGKSFGFGKPNRHVQAVKDVTLDLRRGETLGVVGENGSGKSTLARCIIRLLESDSGNILLDGEDIRARPPNLRPYRKKSKWFSRIPSPL